MKTESQCLLLVTNEVILGRPMLEMVGIHSKELLTSVVDRMGASVDVGAMVDPENYSAGSIACILKDGV